MIWTFKTFLYRIWHCFTWLLVRILPFPTPDLIKGAGSTNQLVEKLRANQHKKLLIVTDTPLMSIGLLDNFLAALSTASIDFVIHDRVQPNPSIENVETGVSFYKVNRCDGIIAFGGGSPIDCAKIIGARIRNPFLSVRAMAGLFRVRIPLPPLYCVPTTAGTGSETTIAAVITDAQDHKKLIVTDISLVPDVAVLDPELMIGLPPHITGATGMDALTHAVESYIGLVGTTFTKENGEQATKLIFENLETAYEQGNNIEARHNMAMASFYAGSAFTRAYVGYVHAIAHNMGALYGTPHGLANAIILPYILDFCRDAVPEKLAKLAVIAGCGSASESHDTLSKRFVEQVRKLNEKLNIPTTIDAIKEQDVTLIVDRVMKESHPEYPVPKFMNRTTCEKIIRQLMAA